MGACFGSSKTPRWISGSPEAAQRWPQSSSQQLEEAQKRLAKALDMGFENSNAHDVSWLHLILKRFLGKTVGTQKIE